MSRHLLFSVAIATLLTSVLLAQQTRWIPRPTTGSPSFVGEGGFAYDPIANEHIAFGGAGPMGFSGDTYRLDAQGVWTLLPQGVSPSARLTTMVFDLGRGVHVLYGGQTATSANLFDTWEFNGLFWTQVATPANPGSKIGTAMSYDVVEQKTILFSGLGYSIVAPPDTWCYDGVTWTRVSPAVQPASRRFHAMVYDSMRGVHLLFGGRNFGGSRLDDTWEYDAATNTWTEIFPPTIPPARERHAMAYDAARGVVTIFGGLGSTGTLLSDTWEYDGTTWTQVITANTPTPRYGGRFADTADPTTKFLFGNSDPNGMDDDDWLYSTVFPSFPGNGADCRVQALVNGSVTFTPNGEVPLTTADQVELQMDSPNGGLVNQALALVLTPYPLASPPTGLPLLGGGNPSDVWVDPANAVVILDGLVASSAFFTPRLQPGGLTLGPYNVPTGLAGIAANLQLFVNAPGLNPVNLGVSDALALQFN